MARVIGASIGDLTPDEVAKLRGERDLPLDLLFQDRLKELVELGCLAYQGDLTQMRFCELRLHPSD